MIFISAGHNSQSKTIKADPGAVNKDGIKEGDLTIEFRDLVCKELDLIKVKYITDYEGENLSMYLKRIKTGNGSVVLEYHFDSAASETATGTTGLISTDADRLDKAFAKKLTDTTAITLGIRNRGVITEAQSHRGKLALMRKEGIVCLLELGFLSNPKDLEAYHFNKRELARQHALILKEFEDMI